MPAESTFRSIHHVHYDDQSKIHNFSKNDKPLITIKSGEEVTFDNTHAGFGNLTRDTKNEDLEKLGLESPADLEKLLGRLYVTGPVFVEGAEVGDELKIEILELQTGSWGWTAIIPGLGLFNDKIPGPKVKIFDLEDPEHVMFNSKIRIPAQPFYGTMGVAPGDETDIHVLFPNNSIGGNFDCRYLGVGSVLYLPVNVPGALFSVGDGHFAQGDGEITGTALETTMRSRIRLSVIKHHTPCRSPHYRTNAERVKEMVSVRGKGEHGVLATANNRNEAVREAVWGLIEWLCATHGLGESDAYMLFSIAGNIKMMHDLGWIVYTASASIPLGIFLDD